MGNGTILEEAEVQINSFNGANIMCARTLLLEASVQPLARSISLGQLLLSSPSQKVLLLLLSFTYYSVIMHHLLPRLIPQSCAYFTRCGINMILLPSDC